MRRKNNNTIELQKAICPVGPWTKRGPWIYWYGEHCVLSPKGCLILVPDYAIMYNANSHLAIAYYSKTLIMIDETGVIHWKGILERWECPVYMSIGDCCIFIVSEMDDVFYFSMIPNSSLPSPRYSWRMVAFHRWRARVIGLAVIRGDPDVFAIFVGRPSPSYKWTVCFINTREEICCFPHFFDTNGFTRVVHSEERGKGKIAVEIEAPNLKTMEIRLGACDNLVQLDLGDGVFFSEKMVSLPHNQENALQQFLEPFLIQGDAK